MKARLALVVLLASCAGGGPPTAAPSTRGDEPGATRASREGTEALAPAAPSGPASYRLTPLGEREIEDGFGGVVVVDAVGIDLDSARFPARALDPVLHLGTRRYGDYHYVDGALRFAVAASVLAEGPLYVQYGEDLASRVELALAEGGSGRVAP